MTNFNIYLSEDVAEKLKEVENKSGLINSLLRKHFEEGKLTDEQIIAEVKEKIAINKKEIKEERSLREKVIETLRKRLEREPTEEEIIDYLESIDSMKNKIKEQGVKE